RALVDGLPRARGPPALAREPVSLRRDRRLPLPRLEHVRLRDVAGDDAAGSRPPRRGGDPRNRASPARLVRHGSGLHAGPRLASGGARRLASLHGPEHGYRRRLLTRGAGNGTSMLLRKLLWTGLYAGLGALATMAARRGASGV